MHTRVSGKGVDLLRSLEIYSDLFKINTIQWAKVHGEALDKCTSCPPKPNSRL